MEEEKKKKWVRNGCYLGTSPKYLVKEFSPIGKCDSGEMSEAVMFEKHKIYDTEELCF